MMGRTKVTINPKGEVVHLRTKKPVGPRLLDGRSVKVPPNEDPRKALADWMIAEDNPYFARAIVNRLWTHFFGIGLANLAEGAGGESPPSHKELLDILARTLM